MCIITMHSTTVKEILLKVKTFSPYGHTPTHSGQWISKFWWRASRTSESYNLYLSVVDIENKILRFNNLAILLPTGPNPLQRGQGFHNLGRMRHWHYIHAFSFFFKREGVKKNFIYIWWPQGWNGHIFHKFYFS